MEGHITFKRQGYEFESSQFSPEAHTLIYPVIQVLILLCLWFLLQVMLRMYSYLKLWASQLAQMVKKSACNLIPGLDPWVRKIPWRREWQCTPVFLPEEFHGQRGLMGYSPWGPNVLDRTEPVTLTPWCLSFCFWPSTYLIGYVN